MVFTNGIYYRRVYLLMFEQVEKNVIQRCDVFKIIHSLVSTLKKSI